MLLVLTIIGLMLSGLVWGVFGGVKFFSRAEVKDVLAYLRLCVNPADSLAGKRVVNLPARGIGATTVQRIAALPLPEGYQLQTYRVTKVLSAGGFSIVYLATDERGESVAIKEYMPAALATRKGVEDTGGKYEPHPAEAVVDKMIEIGRPSRLSGAGFYEYVDGKRTRLWPGLRERTLHLRRRRRPLRRHPAERAEVHRVVQSVGRGPRRRQADHQRPGIAGVLQLRAALRHHFPRAHLHSRRRDSR